MSNPAFKIGNYHVLRKIASGGMAELYEAQKSNPSGNVRPIALKKILDEFKENAEFQLLFEHEASISQRFIHPNIVQTHGLGIVGSTHVLEMEYIHGINLRLLISKLKSFKVIFPVKWSVYIIQEICAGLHYAHLLRDSRTNEPLGIVHRDISPHNLMISFEGGVKIIDFGIAHSKDAYDDTASGRVKGKCSYMSPEQASGEWIDSRTDLFALGIILWELLTGKRLFTASSELKCIRKVREAKVPPPSLFNANIPRELDEIVLKALSRDTELRYQSADEMRSALMRFLENHRSKPTQIGLSTTVKALFPEESRLPSETATHRTVSLKCFPEKYDFFQEMQDSALTLINRDRKAS